MQRQIVTIPRSLMRMLTCDWRIDWRGQGLGETAAGVETVVHNKFPRWIGTPTVHLRREAINQWDAIRDTAQGMVNIYRVPMVHPLGFDWGAAAGALGANGVPFSGDRGFSGGQGFAYAPMALSVGAFSVGAVEITLDVSPTGIAPRVGQIMSVADWPFRITSILTSSGTEYTVTIQLPLRAALRDGDVIRMEGVGLFEAAEQGMGATGYDRNQVSRPTLAFQEVLRR